MLYFQYGINRQARTRLLQARRQLALPASKGARGSARDDPGQQVVTNGGAVPPVTKERQMDEYDFTNPGQTEDPDDHGEALADEQADAE